MLGFLRWKKIWCMDGKVGIGKRHFKDCLQHLKNQQKQHKGTKPVFYILSYHPLIITPWGRPYPYQAVIVSVGCSVGCVVLRSRLYDIIGQLCDVIEPIYSGYLPFHTEVFCIDDSNSEFWQIEVAITHNYNAVKAHVYSNLETGLYRSSFS